MPVVPSIASPLLWLRHILEVVLPLISHSKFDGRFEQFDKFEFVPSIKESLVVVEVQVVPT